MRERTPQSDPGVDRRPVMPPRLAEGSRPVQSLGRIIDNLLGDRRIRARAEKRVNELFRSS
ncbi:MAG: hypothetical protein ACRDJJ_06275 [Actinomycetota bacterium]